MNEHVKHDIAEFRENKPRLTFAKIVFCKDSPWLVSLKFPGVDLTATLLTIKLFRARFFVFQTFINLKNIALNKI